MRVVLQRVAEAAVEIGGRERARIGRGLLVLLGIEEGDGAEDIEWLCGKIVRMRLFPDPEGRMNLPLAGAGAGLLVISQFTLHASTRKGNRPGFARAARPEAARPLYERFLEELERLSGAPVARGEFGADMKVRLVNDGPVTIVVDSRIRE